MLHPTRISKTESRAGTPGANYDKARGDMSLRRLEKQDWIDSVYVKTSYELRGVLPIDLKSGVKRKQYDLI